MANQLSAIPWQIDTAAATVLFASRMQIHQFVFTDYSSATDKVVVTDAAGNIIWSTVGNTDLTAIASQKIGYTLGLIVSTLGSGRLLVYVK